MLRRLVSNDGSHPEASREWLQGVVGRALREALDDAETAFRKSLTPDRVHAQVIGADPAKRVHCG